MIAAYDVRHLGFIRKWIVDSVRGVYIIPWTKYEATDRGWNIWNVSVLWQNKATGFNEVSYQVGRSPQESNKQIKQKKDSRKRTVVNNLGIKDRLVDDIPKQASNHLTWTPTGLPWNWPPAIEITTTA